MAQNVRAAEGHSQSRFPARMGRETIVMARAQAIHYAWRQIDVTGADGEVETVWAMVPSMRYRKVAERQFGAGGEYVLEPVSERSLASNSQYHAALRDLFDSVPETLQARWPNIEHFRAWLLIETNWYDEIEAPDGKPLVITNRPYVRVIKRGNRTIILAPKSQSMRAMGKSEFEQSKRDVLDLAAQIVGTTRTEAIRNAGRAA